MSRSSVVVLRTVLEQVGGFDPRAGCLADWDCWITLALGYGPPALADDALVAIRSVPDEFSSAGRDVWSCYQYVVAKHSVSAGQQALSFPRAPRPLFVHSMSQRCASNRGEARSRFVHGLRTPQSPPLGIRRASGFARARAWRARCTIPKTWIHSAEGWLTQLMKLEVRDGQDR
jgi:hypothetical protein